jgi:hypothetical protein
VPGTGALAATPTDSMLGSVFGSTTMLTSTTLLLLVLVSTACTQTGKGRGAVPLPM